MSTYRPKGTVGFLSSAVEIWLKSDIVADGKARVDLGVLRCSAAVEFERGMCESLDLSMLYSLKVKIELTLKAEARQQSLVLALMWKEDES